MHACKFISRQAPDGTFDLMMFNHVYDTLEPTSRLLEKGSMESLRHEESQ